MTACQVFGACLSIMLCEPEPLLGLNSCPDIANELLSLLVAPSDPGGLFQQGHKGHQGVVGPDHASQDPQRKKIEVV